MIITILRKTLEGTITENTLKHGCGSINIDATRISTSDSLGGGRLKGPTDMSQTCGGSEWDRPWMNDSSKRDHYVDVAREKVEKAENLGRWPANFILTHKEGCELKGTKKVKGHKGYPNGPGGIWSKKYQEEHQKDRSLTDVKTVKDNEAWMGHADEDGKETVADWDCVEGCSVKKLSNDDGGSSRFFKQFKKGKDQ